MLVYTIIYVQNFWNQIEAKLRIKLDSKVQAFKPVLDLACKKKGNKRTGQFIY